MRWHQAPAVAAGLRPAAGDVMHWHQAPTVAVGLRPAAGGVMHWHQAPTVAVELRPAAGGVMHWHQAPATAVGLQPAAGGGGSPAPGLDSDMIRRASARRWQRGVQSRGNGGGSRRAAGE